MAVLATEMPGLRGGPEQPRPFLATPQRVSEYLELKTDEVTAQMRSVEGRQALFNQMMEHEADIREDHADFHPETLQTQLELAGETLAASQVYMETVKSPEKKGLLSRAWDTVKAFPHNYPTTTALLAAAAVAGSIAAGFYFAGNWEMLMTGLGLSKITGAAEAASELAPVMAPTEALPMGGIYDIAPGALPPVDPMGGVTPAPIYESF